MQNLRLQNVNETVHSQCWTKNELFGKPCPNPVGLKKDINQVNAMLYTCQNNVLVTSVICDCFSFSHAYQTYINKTMRFQTDCNLALGAFLKHFPNTVDQSGHSEACGIPEPLLAKTVKVAAHHVLTQNVEAIQNKF